MKPVICFTLFVFMAAATALAQPSVAKNGILNAASDAYVGLPNSSIAQGSIFTIYGTNLGPSSSPGLNFPLQTTLGGVAIKVTSGGTTVNAIPMSVGANQVSAVLPGNTPPGNATLTVTYNNQTSAAASFQVIASSFGIFASNQAGYGPGIITNSNFQVLGLTSAAHPNDAAIIWGTGLGASPGDDGSKPPQQIDLTSLSVSVYVGSQQANVLYRGRSFFTGEDQINFTVPPGILGCHVPVAVQIGNVVSNWVTMPIAPAGTNTCSDPGGPSTSQLQQGSLSFGNISFIRSTSTSSFLGTTTTTSSDTGSASFIKYSAQQLNVANNPYQVYTIGSCTVISFRGSSGTTTDVIQPTVLDAGSALTVTGPNGQKQLPKSTGGYYFATLAGQTGTTTLPPYLNAGFYTVSGPGGADVGAFTQNFTISTPLTWTNQDSVNTITRSAGQLVTWSGGDPNSTVEIIGSSFVIGTAADGSDTVGSTFICTAPDSAGQFTIPAVVLLALPAGSSQSVGGFTIPSGNLSIETVSTTQLTIPKIDLATIDSIVSIGKGVTYQ